MKEQPKVSIIIPCEERMRRMKIGMISLYPPKGLLHADLGGVASYTKNLVSSLSLFDKSDLIIFANKIDGEKDEYTEDKAKIIRCWDKKILFPLHLFWNIFKERRNVDVVHIQHEYFLYGGALSAVTFPLLLFLVKILRKPTIVTIHGVIPLSKFSNEFMEQNNMKGNALILKYGLWGITKLICWFSDKIVVHGSYFKNILATEYGIDRKKIAVIPHGIEERRDLIPKKKAKQILGVEDKNTLLFFGYITGYKGIETLINAFGYLDDKKYVLFIAGGEHPRLKKDIKYRDYIKKLEEMAKKVSKNIIFTGFIPGEKIYLYFSAADLAILPYTVAMSSSGALSLIMAYEKLFLVSNAFKNVIESDEFIFGESPQELAEKIENLFSYEDLHERCLRNLKKIREKNSWKNVAQKTYELCCKLMRSPL